MTSPGTKSSYPRPPPIVEPLLRRLSRVSHPWRCAQQQPPVAYFPPAKPLRQRKSPSTCHLFGSTRPRRRIQRRQIYELQLHPPSTTAVSVEINYLLPSSAGGLWRHNQCEIRRSIQAVLKVVPAPACFWDRGARCFVVRVCVLEQLDKNGALFGGSVIRDSKAFRRAVQVKHLCRTYSGKFSGSLKLGRL